MGNDLLFAGIVVLIIVVLYTISRMRFKYKELNVGLQILGIGTILIMLLVLIPKIAMDDNSFCAITPDNITKNGDNTSIDYVRTCFDNPNTTSTSFYKWNLWIFRIVIILSGIGFIISMILLLNKIRLKK